MLPDSEEQQQQRVSRMETEMETRTQVRLFPPRQAGINSLFLTLTVLTRFLACRFTVAAVRYDAAQRMEMT